MKKYLLFRLLITALGFLLVTFYLSQLPAAIQETTAVYLYSVLGVYLLVGGVSLLTFRAWCRSRNALDLQVLLDFVPQALLIWSTGGIVSIFSPILFVTLAAATAVTSTRGAFLLATLATLLLGGTTFSYGAGYYPATSSWAAWLFAGENSAFVSAYLFASILALYAISTLGSKLTYGLRNVEHMQTEIMESMGEGILAADRFGNIVYLNKEARNLLGLLEPAATYRSRPLAEVLARVEGNDERDREGRRTVLLALGSGQRRRFEARLADQHGKVRPIEVKTSTVLDDKGRLRCRVGLFSDLTLKRQIEAAERRIQKLEELQVMAMGIAHEIRNPLASVRGCVQEISRGAVGDSRQRSFAEIVMRESDRLDRIIEDFLGYTRSEPVDLVPLELSAILSDSVTLVRSRADFASRELEFVAPELEIPIRGDRDRLLQVFLNLLLNALQATCPERGRISVRLRTGRFGELEHFEADEGDPAGSGVEILIRDNGSGLEAVEIRQAFTPFYTTKRTGTGLGLSIVDRIVREHHGFVDLEGDPEGGTRARVLLPAFETAVGEEAPSLARGGREGTPQEVASRG